MNKLCDWTILILIHFVFSEVTTQTTATVTTITVTTLTATTTVTTLPAGLPTTMPGPQD